MYTNKSFIRQGIILATIVFSLFSVVSVALTTTVSADALSEILGGLSDTNPYAGSLSADVRTKLDAFMTKVVSMKSSTETAKYTNLLSNISTKLTAFQSDSRYQSEAIQNILGYLIYEVKKVQSENVVTNTDSPVTVSISQSLNSTAVSVPFTVTWSSLNATACTVMKTKNGGSPEIPFGWTSQPNPNTSGSATAAPSVVGTHVFTITCTGAG